MFFDLSVVFYTFECASYLVHELLEHLPACLFIEDDPSADYHHLYDNAENLFKVHVVEKSKFVNLFPIEVIDASFAGKNVFAFKNALEFTSFLEFRFFRFQSCFFCVRISKLQHVFLRISSKSFIQISYLLVAYVQVELKEIPDESYPVGKSLLIEVYAKTVLVESFLDKIKNSIVLYRQKFPDSSEIFVKASFSLTPVWYEVR